MEDQKADLGVFGVAVQIDVSWKYLDLRTRCKWEDGALGSLQAAVRIRPSLVACKFLIPRPPSCLELQMAFQALRQRLLLELFSLIPVHQKFLMIDVSLARNFLENKMLDM